MIKQFMSRRAVLKYLRFERQRCIENIEQALKEENPTALLQWFDTLSKVNERMEQCGKH